MRESGKALGLEFVGRDVNITLYPGMDMVRVPQDVIIKDSKPHKVC